jgi:hypothetical protein
MRWPHVGLGIVSLALGLLLLGPGHTEAVPTGFVTRSGGQLMLDGQPYQFSGLNIYNANSDGWCWYQMNTGPALDQAFSSIGPGKTVVRAWFNQPLAIDKNTGLRDWTGFDHTLSVAAAHGVKVIVTLSGQWGECGDGGANSYKGTDWYTSGYLQVDPTMLVSYRDWVAEVVDRYKDSPTVMAWQLMNEAEVKDSIGGGCDAGTGPRDVLAAWASDVGGLVKSIDPDHLLSLGTIGSGQCGTANDDYAYVHALPEIDLCEYHDYWDPAPMPGDQWNGLQVRINQCASLNKPLFIGEVGVRPNDVGGTLDDRANVLRSKIAAQRAAGVDGFVAWAWSNLGSTLDNFDIGPADPALEALILNDNCPSTANPLQENADGDEYGDACEAPQCVTVVNHWAVPAGDDDCDGYPSSVAASGKAPELSIGTLTLTKCAVTAGPNNEPLPDAWPVDFNDDQKATILDVATFSAVFGSMSPGPPYDVRHDFNANGSITITDVAQYSAFFGKSCSP